MTDKELIQALRSCQKARNCTSCEALPNCQGLEELQCQVADRLETLLAENEHLRNVAKKLWCEKRYCADAVTLSTEGGGGVMKCTECPEYTECRSRYDLRIKRHLCLKAKEPKVYTNADRIRAMSDEELMDFLWQFNEDSFENVMPFCKNTVECGEKLDSNDISTEMCKRCLLDKLQQPWEDSPTVEKG